MPVDDSDFRDVSANGEPVGTGTCAGTGTDTGTGAGGGGGGIEARGPLLRGTAIPGEEPVSDGRKRIWERACASERARSVG
jgi:hypothetical protein